MLVDKKVLFKPMPYQIFNFKLNPHNTEIVDEIIRRLNNLGIKEKDCAPLGHENLD